MTLPAYVLAGGRSSRLGEDKARAMLDDKTTVLQALVGSLDGRFSSWTAVADRVDKYADLGIRTIADARSHRGPLGGILRAAIDAEPGYFFVTSCDRVGLRGQWVERLVAGLTEEPKAVSFVEEGRRQPLFAIYHTDLASIIERRLHDGQRAVWRLLEAVDAAAIEAPPGWEKTFSINRPRDLRRARRCFAAPR